MLCTIETYKKRIGTVNHGKEFEYLMCAFYALKLIDCKVVSDFEMYTNHASCLDFDDVALRVKFIDGSVKLFLLQLKHSENNKKNLYLRELEAPKGDFSLSRYQQCHQNINLDEFKKDCEENKFDVRFILFTNKHAAFEDRDKLTLQPEECQIKQSTSDLYQNFLNTNEDENCIFTIKNCQANSCTVLENFLKNFFIYTNQKNHQSIKKIIGELLNKQLSCNFDVEKFIIFFKKWWEGKFVLTKPDVIVKITELVFSPWIKTLSNQKYDNRSKLLKQAIMIFDVTVVGDVGGDIVETIWDHPICDEKFIKMVTQKFGLTDRHVDKLTVENKIFWYMDKVPFVIEVNESNKNQIQSAIFLLKRHKIKKKLVLIGDCKQVSLPDDWEIFENLSCLKEKEEHLYRKIIKEFRISFQGNGMVSIENLIGSDEENSKFLGIKELFLILKKDEDGNCVEEKKEDLPSEYIPRVVSAIILDANKILQHSFLKKNFLIINYDHQYNLIADMIRQRNIEMMEISKFFQLIEYKPINQRTIIIASKEECTMNNFQNICSKIERNVHLFKPINGRCFLLLLSNANQEEFKLCLKESVQIDETNIHNVLDGPINSLCAEPGMGKSTTLKYLKNTTPTDFWGVFIELKPHNYFFKRKPSFETIMNKFLDIEDIETDTFPYKIKQILLRRKKIVFFFDGLDEMEHDCIDYVIDSIKKIILQGFHVWISSRENLKEKMEKSLNLFSVGIVELNQTQQESYIRTRLEKNNYKNEEIKQIVEKISNNAYIANNNKILGIPLQLYIITQILIDNKSYNLKLDDEMFVLTNLYKMFFKGNIKHSLRKKGLEDEDLAERMSNSELERYAIPALKTCLREDHFRILNLNPLEISKGEKFLLSIKNSYDQCGIINQINKEGKAVFHHQTYVEYFACMFLSSNFEKVRLLGYSCLEYYYPNLRLMLDLELASANPLHLSVIYNNTEMMEQFIKNSKKDKDKGGRSPLHLICTNLNRCPPLGKYNDSYEEIHTSLTPKISSLQTITLKLVELYSILENDELYEWNVMEYALECGCLFLIEAVLTKQKKYSDKVLSFFSEIYDDSILAYYATKHDYPELLHLVLRKTEKCMSQVNYGERKKSLLHIAAEAQHQNLQTTELLLHYGFQVNIKDSDERTPLHYAVLYGKNDLAKLLIKNGADMHCIDYYGNSLLHEAYSRKDYDLLEHLLDLNIDPDIENKDKQTVLFLAARDNNADLVKLLVDKRADVNYKGAEGRTILHIICLYGYYDLVEYALNHNIDPNIKDNNGITALHLAQDLETVKLLISKGADINSKTDYGQSILYSACVRGNCDVVEYLLNLKMDLNINDKNGETPLYCAAYCEWYDVVKLLIDRGANVNSITNDGRTALHEACLKGNYELTEYLMRRNADLNIKDKDGITALHLALVRGHKFVVKLLINRDVGIKCVTNSGQTLLHAACIGGILEYVDYLLNRNIDPNIKDKNETTALDLAIHHGNKNITKLLIEKGADIHFINSNGFTLLHKACCQKENYDLVEYLLNQNFDPNSKDKKGRTPLYFAAYYGKNYCILKLLICKGGGISTEINGEILLLHARYILKNYDLMEFIINQKIDVNIKDKYGKSVLYYAVLNEISDVVKLLIEGGADMNIVADSGDTLLHEACMKRNCEIIKCLLDHGIDPNIKNNNGTTALYVSVTHQMTDVVKLLINKGSDINSVNNDGRTILHEACQLNNYEIIEFLLDHSIDPNIKDKYGNAALHYAVRDKKINVMKLLINKGADINCREKDGQTVLHMVLSFGYYDYNLIEYLLKNNIDPNIKDNYGQTALHLAVVRQEVDVVKLLIQNGADINSVNKNGSTVLHMACSLPSHNNDLIKYLLNKNIDPNMKDKNGQTPLHLLCVSCGTIDVLKLLITKGADVNSVDSAGCTVLNKACSLNREFLILYLLNHTNGDLNIKNNRGNTAIYYTVTYGNLKATKLLISRGAVVNVVTNDGYSLLDIALKNNNKEMVDLLLESGLKLEKAKFADQYNKMFF